MDTAYKLLIFLLFLFLLISNARAGGSANDIAFDTNLPGGGQMVNITLMENR